jgi:hypothetical protein
MEHLKIRLCSRKRPENFSKSLIDEQETERSDLGLKEKILRDSE